MTGPFKGKPAWSLPITRLRDCPGVTSGTAADRTSDHPCCCQGPSSTKKPSSHDVLRISTDHLAHATPTFPSKACIRSSCVCNARRGRANNAAAEPSLFSTDRREVVRGPTSFIVVGRGPRSKSSGPVPHERPSGKESCTGSLRATHAQAATQPGPSSRPLGRQPRHGPRVTCDTAARPCPAGRPAHCGYVAG